MTSDLGAVEGDPRWAKTSAATITQLLESGVDADPADDTAIAAARREVRSVDAGCEPD